MTTVCNLCNTTWPFPQLHCAMLLNQDCFGLLLGVQFSSVFGWFLYQYWVSIQLLPVSSHLLLVSILFFTLSKQMFVYIFLLSVDVGLYSLMKCLLFLFIKCLCFQCFLFSIMLAMLIITGGWFNKLNIVFFSSS